MKKLPPYNPKELEEAMLKTWQREKTFAQSLKLTESSPKYTFYDGPPFANGLPHYGHLTTSVVKDAIPRLKTMQGHYVPRRFGWDCHGLPAEMEAEKQLDLSGRAKIIEYGIDKFNQYCRQSVLRYTDQWQHFVTRLGRWVDFENNYHTMDQSYMESVVWVFKQLWDKDLIYQGARVLPYCPVCETSLSNFEAKLDDAFREREDDAVTVEFLLEDGRHLLVWTTTPWTLPANLAVAVGSNIDYVELSLNGKKLVLAEDALSRYETELGKGKVARHFLGKELVGLRYQPLFDYFQNQPNAFKVLTADFVTTEDGTGVVHLAPGFGEDDQIVCEQNDIAVVCPVDEKGRYTAEVVDYVGELVFDANIAIVERLTNKGVVLRHEKYKHNYPHCWRTDNPLIYKAVSSWFVSVSKLKQKLLKNNQQIEWTPAYVKDGSFGKWLENARDWNISRNRFWGAPLPIWRNQEGDCIVIGSLDELKQLAKDPEKVTDWHRPMIDQVVIEKNGQSYHRVEEVLDCWFESGAMPYAQDHYPFELSQEQFEQQFPADFIVEYNGQTRGWFYTLHVLATALFDQPAFKNCIAHGVMLGTDGRKMSKRLGNYPPIEDVFDIYGSDSLRYYLLTNPIISGETVALDENAIRAIQRNLFMTLYNSASFLSLYAQIDGYKLSSLDRPVKLASELDKWMIARVDQTIDQMSSASERYQLAEATKPLAELVDDLSNWYVRRSRRRFWKSEDDQDKQQAYQTLTWSIITICQMLAPWSPFMADYLFRQLTEGATGAASSVHLTTWPKPTKPDSTVLGQMASVRQIVTDGLAQRAAAGIKVRQPLAAAEISLPTKISNGLVEIVRDELNVKQVVQKTSQKVGVKLNTKITQELREEGLSRDLIRYVQAARKKADFNVEDRIRLAIVTLDRQVEKALNKFQTLIGKEVLAEEITFTQPSRTDRYFSTTTKLDGTEVTIYLERV